MEIVSPPLYLVWNADYQHDQPILDEQHRGIVSIINSLHFFIQQGTALDSLGPTIDLLRRFLDFHFKTEGGILLAVESPLSEEYKKLALDSLQEFDLICQHAIRDEQPQEVLLFLKRWWQSHLELHERINPYFRHWTGEYCQV